MNRIQTLAVGLAALMLQPAMGESICARMAAEAQRLPVAAWNAGPDPMLPVLQIDAQHADPGLTPVERELARAPALREDLSLSDTQPLAIEHLRGTDIYRAVSVQGSANCEYSSFVEAKPGTPWRHVRAPLSVDGQNVPCTIKSGAFAHPYGEAVFAIYGFESMSSLDRSYEIAPWNRTRWAPACSLSLKFRKEYRLKGEFCSDASVCKAGRALAMKYGPAFDADGGVNAPDAGQASPAVKKAIENIDPMRAPEFPTPNLGKRPPNTDMYLTTFSNATVERFPVQVNGEWLVAIMAHAGIGWRESDVTLLGLYLPEDGGSKLRPVAGFQVESVNAGLISAQAEDLH